MRREKLCKPVTAFIVGLALLGPTLGSQLSSGKVGEAIDLAWLIAESAWEMGPAIDPNGQR